MVSLKLNNLQYSILQLEDFLIIFISFCVESGQGQNVSRDKVQGPIIGGPFTLVDTENRLVTERSFLGNWVLLYFGYTSSPDIGPEQVKIMAKTIDTLGLSLKTTRYLIFSLSGYVSEF